MRLNNNLTFLRWLAAFLVMYGHSFIFLGLPEPIFLGSMSLGHLGVSIFFSISGYLVTQSWENNKSICVFFQRRTLRIFPALIVCIFLTVLIIGPFLTTLKLDSYFFHPYTRGYFTNIGLYITFALPGVFETNHYPNAVNGSLWTLPVEFSMYIILSLVGVLRIPRLGWVFLTIILMAFSQFWALTAEPLVIYRTDIRQIVLLGVYFWVGALFYKYRIQEFFNISNVLIAVFVWVSLTRWPIAFNVISWLILPYLTLAFGLANHKWLSFFTKYDYSYGIYIYAFPVQQAIVCLYPNMQIGQYLLSTAIVTIGLSAISWHFIELPSLQLKKYYPR